MKRIILLLACLVGMAATLPAQRARSIGKTTKVKREKEKVALTWGVRAGMNYANVLNAPDGSGRIGFNVGGNLDVGFCNWFHMQTGLYLSQKGVTAEYQNYYSVTVEGMNMVEHIDRYRSRFAPLYIEVPVLASFRIGFSDNSDIQFGVGPYFALDITGDTYEFMIGGTKLHTGTMSHYETSKLSRFDVGVQANLGVTVKHIYLGVGYQIGLPSKKFWREDGYSSYNEHVIRTSNVMVNVGYNF